MNKKSSELIKTKKFAVSCAAIALALAVGSMVFVQRPAEIPELPSYTDPVLEVTIEDEETPLAAAPKVTTNTTKKTTKKNVKLKKAAAKTYTKKLPTIKKTTTKTQNKADETVKTDTTILTATTEKYTKKSKVKVVTTTVTTTVKTTTIAKSAGSATPLKSGKTDKYEADVSQLAPLMDGRVISAYKKLGFKVTIDPSVSYAGYFDARSRMIVLRRADDTIYHELGHFLAFIAGNVDKSSAFTSVYGQEKSAFTGVNKAYATQNSSEYFAESTRNYVLDASALKGERPKTYAAVTEALDKVTEAQVTKIQTLYAPVWK